MIYLNEQLADNIASFSARFQTILSLINGGTDWLRWAISDSVMPACRVKSEEELLALIQTGLHSNNFIYFNTFRVCLEKIMTMPDGDVEQLALVRNTSFDSETSLQPLLTRNNLLGYTDLLTANAFINSHNLGNTILFESPGFDDMLVLTRLVTQLEGIDPALQTQAINFALDKAGNVNEFSNLLNFFVYSANNVLPKGTSPLLAVNEVDLLHGQLLPITYQLLFTPNTGTSYNEEIIRHNLRQVISSSRFIGYRTSSAAMYNLVQNITISGQNNASIQTQAESYLSTLRNQVGLANAPTGEYSQDGQLITYQYDDNTFIGVDAEGYIFILPQTKLTQANQTT